MLTNAKGSLQQVLRGFGRFSPGQKAVTIVAVLSIVIGGYLFSQWASKPAMAPLFSSLSSTDASAIVDKLNTGGTSYQLADGGTTILVPQDKVYVTRLAMSGAGLPSGSAANGSAAATKLGMGATQGQQDAAARQQLEGELTKTIESISGVQAAIVHLAIPTQNVFLKATDKTTASVLVKTAPGQVLTSQQVTAITNLVGASVPGLSPDEVTVTDSNGDVLSSSSTGAGGGGAGDLRGQQTRDYEDRVSASLQAMLDKIVGPGHSVVHLTADLDYDKTQTKTTTMTGNAKTPPISSSITKETYKGAGGGTGAGVLGPGNISVPSGSATTAGAGNTYTKDSATVNNALTQKVEDRTAAPGAVRKLDVSVLLDKRTSSSVSSAQVQSMITTAVGINPTRGDQLNVAQAAFDQTASKDAATALADQKKAASASAQTSLIKTGALGLLVLATLVIALLKGRKKKGSGSLTDEERIQIEQLQRSLELQGASRPELEGATGALAAIETAPSNPTSDLAAIARSEIGELVQAQPEEVAALLRGWLADRRG